MGEDKTGLDQVGSCALVVRIFFAKVNQDSEVERSQQTHEDYDIYVVALSCPTLQYRWVD